jgi:PST family polysaccharide transporter
MQFVRQRVLGAVDPVLALAATVVLAVLGAGYWSLVLGATLGSLAGGIAATATCPYPIRLRFDRSTLRSYYSYSWPLVLSNVASLVVVQGSIIAGNAIVGLAGVGAIAIAGNFTRFIGRVETIIKTTMYPAVCRIKDRSDVLLEAFVKSNLVGLMWALPFGFGLAVFAPDLVRFVLGATWRQSEPMFETLGVSVALGTIGYSWWVFFAAMGQTRPFAIAGLTQVLSFLGATLPLMILMGVKGFGYGYLISTLVQLAIRGHYLSRLFEGFSMFRHIGRALAPSIPAVAIVLLIRAVEGPEQTPGAALAMLALFIAVTAAATIAFERPLLAEIFGYVRGRSRRPIAPAGERPSLAS